MKKLLSYHPLHFLVFLIIGIFIQLYTNLWEFGFLYLGIPITVVLLFLFVFKILKRAFFFTCLSFILWIFIGIMSVYIQDDRNYANYYESLKNENSTYLVKVFQVLKTGNYYDKYKVEIIQIDKKKSRGKVLLNVRKDSLEKQLEVDDILVLRPELKELIPPLNPHQFNYKNYLAKQRIFHQVFVDKQQFKIVDKSAVSLLGMSATFRNKIQQSLNKYDFSKNEFGVINALLLGQRQDISKELINDYANAGAIHILAVSGLHVGIILLILTWLFKPIEKIKYGKLLKLFLVVLFLWIFAFIAGLSASVVRAVTMFTFVAIGSISKRKSNIYFSLITSMFFLLLIKPMFLFDVGFQLSYLAVFGIVWVQPMLYSLWNPKYNFFDKIWQLVTVSVAAQTVILPISLYYFHQFPSLFILSNIVIIPFLGIILMGGILIILLAVLEILPQFLADSYGVIINSMNQFVSWVANQEEFLLKEISISFLLMIALYFLILSGIVFLNKKKAKHFLFFLMSIIIFQSVLVYDKHKLKSKNELIIFHKSRNSILGERVGGNFMVYHELDSLAIRKLKMLTSYKIGEDIEVNYTDGIQNIYKIKNTNLLVIDSLGIYQKLNIENSIILLKNSPKINLKRLINELNPVQIIADGNNYKDYINRWKLTCIKEKTPFHYTGRNGVYIIK